MHNYRCMHPTMYMCELNCDMFTHAGTRHVYSLFVGASINKIHSLQSIEHDKESTRVIEFTNIMVYVSFNKRCMSNQTQPFQVTIHTHSWPHELFFVVHIVNATPHKCCITSLHCNCDCRVEPLSITDTLFIQRDVHVFLIIKNRCPHFRGSHVQVDSLCLYYI